MFSESGEIDMVEYKKTNDGSYVHNCYIVRRDDDNGQYLFGQTDDKKITAFLNGYAIIPLEEYAQLTGKDLGDMIANANEADKQLHPVSHVLKV
jgi:hypothetical protein